MSNDPIATTSTNPVAAALDQFIADFLALYEQQNPNLPSQPLDTDWPSPCYQNPGEAGNLCQWKPVRQEQAHPLFEGLGYALDTEIHPDIISYYSRYWSDPLPATCDEGNLSLLFVWNEEDYERLRGNLVGHCMMQRRRKHPLTLFFACTEPEEMVISVDNDSGKVVLEVPGKKASRVLTPSLAEFIMKLKPRLVT